MVSSGENEVSMILKWCSGGVEICFFDEIGKR